jgi:hypothetical protein
MLPDQSLAEKIVAEMSVRYAKDGLQIADVIELSDDEDGDEELSDEGPMPDLSDEGFSDDRAD